MKKRHPDFCDDPCGKKEDRKRGEHIEPEAEHLARQREIVDRAEGCHHDRESDREPSHAPPRQKILRRIFRTCPELPADQKQKRQINSNHSIVKECHICLFSSFAAFSAGCCLRMGKITDDLSCFKRIPAVHSIWHSPFMRRKNSCMNAARSEARRRPVSVSIRSGTERSLTRYSR